MMPIAIIAFRCLSVSTSLMRLKTIEIASRRSALTSGLDQSFFLSGNVKPPMSII